MEDRPCHLLLLVIKYQHHVLYNHRLSLYVNDQLLQQLMCHLHWSAILHTRWLCEIIWFRLKLSNDDPNRFGLLQRIRRTLCRFLIKYLKLFRSFPFMSESHWVYLQQLFPSKMANDCWRTVREDNLLFSYLCLKVRFYLKCKTMNWLDDL